MKLTKKELKIANPFHIPSIKLDIAKKYGNGISSKEIKKVMNVAKSLSNKIKGSK
jgi:hypothetical protein